MSVTPPPGTPAKITGIILAGGLARRWNGEDKGLIPVAGKPMVAHVLDALVPQCDDIIISANRNLDAYAAYGWPVVQDQLSGFLGPLAGLATGMQIARNEWVVLTPCDTPLIGSDLVGRLWSALVSQGGKLAAAHDGRRSQPAFALLHCSLLADLRDYLLSGERKIDPWFERQQRVYADFSDCTDTFININSAADRIELEALIREANSRTPAHAASSQLTDQPQLTDQLQPTNKSNHQKEVFRNDH